jgi:hypothetical protein
MMVVTRAATVPRTKAVRVPNMSWLSMSRPSGSVPNQCVGDGGAGWKGMLASKPVIGLYVARSQTVSNRNRVDEGQDGKQDDDSQPDQTDRVFCEQGHVGLDAAP